MTYKVQIDDQIRDATPDETATLESKVITENAAMKAKSDAIKSAIAKLSALGLNETEIKALVG